MPLSRDALKVLGPVSEALDSKREVGPTSWAEVEICFLSDDRVQLTAGKHTDIELCRFRIRGRQIPATESRVGDPPCVSGEWRDHRTSAGCERLAQCRETDAETSKDVSGPALSSMITTPFVEGVGYRAQFKILTLFFQFLVRRIFVQANEKIFTFVFHCGSIVYGISLAKTCCWRQLFAQ